MENNAMRRRVARLHEKIELGVTGWSNDDFRTLELTTRAGDDNTLKTFSKDFRKLMIRLRKLGYKYDYVVERGISPINGLVHCHALLRIDRDIPHELLSVEWEKIHGAPIVYIQHPRNMHAVRKYIASHMIKAMHEGNGRLMVSKHWLPRGWQMVRKDLNKWVMQHEMKDWKEHFKMAREVLKRWVEGKEVSIPVGTQWRTYPGAVRV